MSLPSLSAPPLSVGASAVYPYSDALASMFTLKDRFGGLYRAYRTIGRGEKKVILLPRALCPLPDDPKQDKRSDGRDVEFSCNFKPRNDEQARVVSESIELLKRGESFITRAPTGFGKTACAMPVIAALGKRTLIVVHKEDLAEQWQAECKKMLGVDVPLVRGAKMPDTTSPVVVGFIQSLANLNKYPPKTFDSYGLVIWDECHRVGADYFSNTAWQFPGKLRWGLSATPDRKDGKEIIFRIQIGRVGVSTSQENLVPRIVFYKTDWRCPRRKKFDAFTRRWEFKKLDHKPGQCGHVTKMLTHHNQRNAIIVAFVKKAYDHGRVTFVLSDLTDHLRRLETLLIRSGVPKNDIGFYCGLASEVYHGSREQRRQAREDAKHRKVILATYIMTAEGTNIPWADTLAMTTPRSDVRQTVGRILRIHEGKREPLVLDLVDNDSPVFQRYGEKRLRWYYKIGAPVHITGAKHE